MDKDKVLNKSLSIRIATNGLSFCTYTPSAKNPFEYKVYDVQHTISLAANLKNALMTDPMLKAEYQRVNVLIVSPNTTYVPIVEFDAEKVEDLYNFNFPDAGGMHISYNILRRSGIAVIFGVERNIYQLLLDDFPSARFYASPSMLIEYISNRNKLNSGNKLFAYLHDRELTLYAFTGERMICVNTFDIVNADDCMYYILNMSHQLNFSQVDDSLVIVGNTGREKELNKNMQNFYKNVSLVDCKEEFRRALTGGIADIPFDLQTLLNCGF